MDISITRHFFFMTYLYIIQNNMKEARTYFSFLERDLNLDATAYFKFSNSQKSMIRKFEDILRTGIVPVPFSINPVEVIGEDVELDLDRKINLEIDLQNFLIETNEKISPLFKFPVRLANIELSFKGGRVDLVYANMDRTIMIPVELKNKKFEYVDSQMKKYLLHYYNKFHYKVYDAVQGVVIAPEFTDYSRKELEKLDVRCVQFKINDNKIKFEVLND